MSDWVAVKDRPPKNGQLCHVYRRIKGGWWMRHRMCIYQAKAGGFQLAPTHLPEEMKKENAKVTHWKPIDEPGGVNETHKPI